MPKRVDANQSAIVAELRAQGISCVIEGAPRTKKNSGRIVRNKRTGQPKLLPSEQWQRWVNTSIVISEYPIEPIAVPVNCRAIFYRDARRGDAVGYYQGLADLLEHRGIVTDDKFIVSWDGSRLEVDRESPRVEVTLEIL